MRSPATYDQRDLLLYADWKPEEIDAASPATNRNRAYKLRKKYGIKCKPTTRHGMRYDAKEVMSKLPKRA